MHTLCPGLKALSRDSPTNEFNSKIDLRSTYWQMAISNEHRLYWENCPGPEHGLWEFTVMTYGLIRATQICQWGLNRVLKDCKDCVDSYINDCIMFSDDMLSHVADLQCILNKLLNSLSKDLSVHLDNHRYLSWDFNTHWKWWLQWHKKPSQLLTGLHQNQLKKWGHS